MVTGRLMLLALFCLALPIGHQPVSAQSIAQDTTRGTDEATNLTRRQTTPAATTQSENGNPAPASPPLRVATKTAPPFVIKTDDGKLTGISIDLWRRIAISIGRDFEFKSYETAGDIVDAVVNGEADVGISALSVTSERERIADFTYPYYQSGLGIAISDTASSEWLNLLRALSSGPFLATVGALALLLLVTGAIIWLIEHRHNSEQFPKDPVQGVGTGFWWSAVTMTTVGYGDKAPITPLGRAVAVVWMFAALILTAVFTAQLTSALTIERFSGPVTNVSDLGRARVGILRNSASREYFVSRRQYARSFETSGDGLQALVDGRIDALVHDAPILSFEIQNGFSGQAKLLDDRFERQGYAAVVAQGSPLRESLNQALLDFTASELWPAIQQQYLGDAALQK